ncbi:TPA: hypothetical protein HA344_00490 [Candidatus Bathyarchaeota archaeon]|nr:hypothetical protein [Candidatus Bathyarchaeota archaeon]
MSNTLSEYFKPGKAIVLVAVLLLASMGLQIYVLPQVLKPTISGEVVEGTVVGVVLIFSYTLTTLGFLFLMMEYFGMKNRVKSYVKLTQGMLPSEALEGKKIVDPETLLVELPKVEKPMKKGLFAGLMGGKKDQKIETKVKEPKPKDKFGLPSIFKGKPKAEKAPIKEPKPKGKFSLSSLFKRDAKPKEEKAKEPKPSFLSRLKPKKKAEPVVEEHVIKKISVEALPLSSDKPAQIVELMKTSEIIIQKPVESVTPTPIAAPISMSVREKQVTAIADLLGGMNTLPKPKDEVTAQFEKLKPIGLMPEVKKEGGEPAAAQPMKEEKPAITEIKEESKKAADLLKAAAEAHDGNDAAKYKTTGVKLPTAKPEKLALTLPPITIPNEPEPTITVEDSEFLKVLTDLRSVVDEMKSKKVSRA